MKKELKEALNKRRKELEEMLDIKKQSSYNLAIEISKIEDKIYYNSKFLEIIDDLELEEKAPVRLKTKISWTKHIKRIIEKSNLSSTDFICNYGNEYIYNELLAKGIIKDIDDKLKRKYINIINTVISRIRKEE